MSRLSQAKARKQLRRGSLVPRSGYYFNGRIVWVDEAQRLSGDSRAACVTCGHRRKDHDGPSTGCRRYDQPDCPTCGAEDGTHRLSCADAGWNAAGTQP